MRSSESTLRMDDIVLPSMSVRRFPRHVYSILAVFTQSQNLEKCAAAVDRDLEHEYVVAPFLLIIRREHLIRF